MVGIVAWLKKKNGSEGDYQSFRIQASRPVTGQSKATLTPSGITFNTQLNTSYKTIAHMKKDSIKIIKIRLSYLKIINDFECFIVLLTVVFIRLIAVDHNCSCLSGPEGKQMCDIGKSMYIPITNILRTICSTNKRKSKPFPLISAALTQPYLQSSSDNTLLLFQEITALSESS